MSAVTPDGHVSLHPAVAIVHRPGSDDFVLRATGQIVGNSGAEGVTPLWQDVLGCSASGH